MLYVPVNDQGEPSRWGLEHEANVSAFGDFWRARRSPEGKGRDEILETVIEGVTDR